MTTKRQMDSLQALRGVAAMLVIMFHAQVAADGLAATLHIPEASMNNFYNLRWLGASGVDIFFVISGFIMVYIAGNEFGKKWASADFLIRRVIRVVPIYWMYTTSMVYMQLAIPSMFNQLTLNWWHVAASYLFIPYDAGGKWGQFPVIYVGWSLSYEMYFYLMFSMLLMLHRRFFLPAMMFILCGPYVLSIVAEKPSSLAGIFLSDELLIEFFFGCIIAKWYSRSNPTSTNVAAFALLVGVLFLVASIFLDNELPRILKWGAPSALIVFGTVGLDRYGSIRVPVLLKRLGDSSYSLYLTQVISLPILGRILQQLGFVRDGSLTILIAVLTVLAAISGYFAFMVIERPVTNALSGVYKRLIFESRTAPA